jgi:hypothetical protein
LYKERLCARKFAPCGELEREVHVLERLGHEGHHDVPRNIDSQHGASARDNVEASRGRRGLREENGVRGDALAVDGGEVVHAVDKEETHLGDDVRQAELFAARGIIYFSDIPTDATYCELCGMSRLLFMI